MRGLPEGAREHLPKTERRSATNSPAGLSQFVRVPAVGAGRTWSGPGCSHRGLPSSTPSRAPTTGRKLAGNVACRDGRYRRAAGRLASSIPGSRKPRRTECRRVDPIVQTAKRWPRVSSGSGLGAWPDAAEQLNEFSHGPASTYFPWNRRIDALTPYLDCLAPGASVSVFAGFGADADSGRFRQRTCTKRMEYPRRVVVPTSTASTPSPHGASGALRSPNDSAPRPLDRCRRGLDLAGSGA